MTTSIPLAAGLSASNAVNPAGASAAPSHDSAERRRLDSHQLFGVAREIEITHGDAVYRLRRTSLGKLILTK